MLNFVCFFCFFVFLFCLFCLLFVLIICFVFFVFLSSKFNLINALAVFGHQIQSSNFGVDSEIYRLYVLITGHCGQ